MATIALINKTNADYLANVKAEMLTLGTPVINVVFDDAQGIYVALEGSHRLTAAKELNLVPVLNVVEVEDTDIYVEDLGLGITDCEYTVQDLLDMAYRATLVDFDDIEIAQG